jgi:hypothetical protein
MCFTVQDGVVIGMLLKSTILTFVRFQALEMMKTPIL